jgi:hypothetical protein
MHFRRRARTVLAAVAVVAFVKCSAHYLVGGTVARPDGDPLEGVLVAPRLKCGGDPTPSAFSNVTEADGGYRSAFTYASDHTVVEFTKADYQTKCVDLAPLWRSDCASADGGVPDRCATVDVTLAPAGANQPGVDAGPALDAGTTTHPIPMTD